MSQEGLGILSWSCEKEGPRKGYFHRDIDLLTIKSETHWERLGVWGIDDLELKGLGERDICPAFSVLFQFRNTYFTK